MFGETVWRKWCEGMRFIYRQGSWLTVHCPASGSIEDFARPIRASTLEDVDRSHNVHHGIKLRFAHGTAHVHLGGMMTHHVRLFLGKDLCHGSAADIEFVEGR